MSDELFALPPFKPAEALVQLKRSLRDLSGQRRHQCSFALGGVAGFQIVVISGHRSSSVQRASLRRTSSVNLRISGLPASA